MGLHRPTLPATPDPGPANVPDVVPAIIPAVPPPVARPAPQPPTLAALFAGFARITLLSIGGGLAAWIRRLVVEQKRWMDETRFLSGYALSQIAPGPNAVNLAVFVGTTLRGPRGAAASLLGLMAPPFLLVLLLGWLATEGGLPPWFDRALSGIGAAAIGLMVATGLRMAKSGIRTLRAAAIAILTAAALAAGANLLLVVALAFPLALIVLATAPTPAPAAATPK